VEKREGAGGTRKGAGGKKKRRGWRAERERVGRKKGAGGGKQEAGGAKKRSGWGGVEGVASRKGAGGAKEPVLGARVGMDRPIRCVMFKIPRHEYDELGTDVAFTGSLIILFSESFSVPALHHFFCLLIFRNTLSSALALPLHLRSSLSLVSAAILRCREQFELRLLSV
jgi:hypothetical protein